MKTLCKSALLGSLAGAVLCAAATAVSAQEIQRLNRSSPMPAIADATVVPPGFTTYYLSGALPSPIKPAANGQPAEYGDTAQQTRSTLDNLKAVMDKLGIGYGDVVAAHVFLDPKASPAEMNKVWATEFGTAAQPNKPARATVHIHSLVVPGTLIEIEFTAAKKP
jgi:enamine deaminase RidA (YjgF/YER057c/UK114 family)